MSKDPKTQEVLVVGVRRDSDIDQYIDDHGLSLKAAFSGRVAVAYHNLATSLPVHDGSVSVYFREDDRAITQHGLDESEFSQVMEWRKNAPKPKK